MLHNKRSHRNEKSMHCNKEKPWLAATRESPRAATKTQHSQKQTNKQKKHNLVRLPQGWENTEPVQLHSPPPKLLPSNHDNTPHTADVRKDAASHFGTKKTKWKHYVFLLRKCEQEETSGWKALRDINLGLPWWRSG